MKERQKKNTKFTTKKKSTNYKKKKNVNGWFIFLFFAHLPLLTKQLFFWGVNFFVIIFFPGINTRKKSKKKKQKKFENMYTIGGQSNQTTHGVALRFYFEIFLFFNLNKIAEEI